MSADTPQAPSPEAQQRGSNQALHWVSRELYATLSEAHEMLERYAEQPSELGQVARFAGLLHSARGALQMAEIHGANLLVAEMEAVAAALIKGQVGTVAEGLDALMRAVVQLPAYLDRILSGGHDVPLILLPMFNDLRAVRGSPLLSESMLFVVNVAPDSLPMPGNGEPTGDDLEFVAGRLHTHYQASLLGWLRGEDPASNLSTMGVVSDNICEAAGVRRLGQLWWVAGAIIEALLEGGLEAGSSAKRLLGQTERLLGRLVEHGEEDFALESADDLLSSMLYYVGRATSDGPKVTSVRDAFALREVLPSRESIDLARADLGGPSTGLMETVAAAIKQDLSGIKDVLDIFVRTGSSDRTELGPQSGELKKVSDTLSVLGLPHLGEMVNEQRQALEKLVVGDDEAGADDLLLAIAAELLCVEDRLEEDLAALVSSVDDHPNPEAGSAREREFAKVVASTLHECNANLGDVKDIISAYASEPGERRDLERLDPLMRGVAAGLFMLERERALLVCEQLGQQITAMLVSPGELPSPLELDCLADALVSLEYYIETLECGRGDPWYMLDNAQSCLNGLSTAPASAIATLEPDVPPIPASASGTFRGLQPFVADSRENIDPELLELFIEESKEEIESIAACFPGWKEEPESRDLLLSVRRSFHTLKGSGRMVGAQVIGEFAWSVENLLNRLINRTLPMTPQITTFIGDAIQALPHLIEQLEVGTVPPFRVDEYIDRASALSDSDRGPVSSGSAKLTLPRMADPGEAKPPSEKPVVGEPALKLVPTAGKRAAQDVTKAAPAPGGEVPEMPVQSAAERDAADRAEIEREAREKALAQRAEREREAAVEIARARAATEQAERDRQAAAQAAIERAAAERAEREATARAREQAQREQAEQAEQKQAEQETAKAEATARRAARKPAQPRTAPPVERMDEELFAVYAEETRGHLATIWAYVEESGNYSSPYPLPEDLHRAWHTLNGGARSAGVEHVAAVTEPMYAYLDKALRGPGTLPEPAIIVMAQVANLIDQTLRGLSTQGGVLPSLTPTLASIASLSGGVILQRPNAEPVPSAETTSADADRDETATTDHPPDTLVTADSSAAGHAADTEHGQMPDAVAPTEDERVSRSAPPELDVEHADVLVDEAAATVEYDEAIAQIFAEEATELLDRADAVLQDWLQTPTASEPAVTELKRILHTLKGGARMAGLSEMGSVSHELESLLTAVQHNTVPSDQPTVDTVQFVLDSLHRNSDRLAAGKGALAMDLVLERLAARQAGTAIPAPQAPAPAPPEAPPVSTVEPPPPVPDSEPPEPVSEEVDTMPAVASATVWQDEAPSDRGEIARVDADLLDNMLNNAGEISIFRSRLEQQLSQLGFSSVELAHTVTRLRDQLRKLEMETEAHILYRHMEEGEQRDEFDPLEMDRYSTIQQLSRALGESVSDLGSIQEIIEELTHDSEALLVQQSRVNAELQDGLMRTRMVPFSDYSQRLSRIVRQTAADVGKRAELRLEGGAGEMDRQVIERMLPPLEHMLRNAVVHGTETAQERRLLGKDETAAVTVRVRREGSEMVISVEDDGAGLDVAAIRRKAVAHGLVSGDETLSESEAMRLILRSGFSTAAQITQAAGRGVGMDVVANEVRRLGGTLDIESRKGAGAHFSIRLPFTMAIMQALLVKTQQARYAIPLPSVEGIVRVAVDELARYLEEDAPTFVYGGQGYRFQQLSALLGAQPAPFSQLTASTPVILVRAGEYSTALVVDEMLGSREIVVKTAGPQIASVRGVSGATIMGDGNIVLILDVGALVRGGPLQPRQVAGEPETVPDTGPLALVVDDSITVRRVTSRLLERSGMRVMTAKDGIDAIALMQDIVPDVMLLDIEMPRMDGYEVVGHVRNDPRLRDLPIVMITSRVGDKHRAHGLALGVDQYLGKPYQESQLLSAIQPLLARKKRR